MPSEVGQQSEPITARRGLKFTDTDKSFYQNLKE